MPAAANPTPLPAPLPNPLPFPALLAGAVLAIVAPAMLAYNVSPSATFLNQAVALAGWGVLLAALIAQLPRGALPWLTPASAGASLALVAMLLCALASPAWSALPWSLALSAAGTLAAALAVLWGGLVLARNGLAASTADAVFGALLLAGLLNIVVAAIQFFAPSWADGNLIAHATGARPGGNLRQANHLSSLLMLSACGLVWWAERAREQLPEWRQLRLAAGGLLMAGLMFAAAITASRTGGVCVLLLGVWGAVDRSLSRHTRALLLASPVLFALSWWGLSAWAAASGAAYGGDAQLHAKDLSSSRLGIWSNTLQLILANPWFGVGWGDFNFAWTLTPFPGRPVAFFDHTHNLPLQLVVELGLPLGLALVALMLWVLWRAGDAAWNALPPARPVARAAFAMVVIMVVHSMVEYPLWYSYFLLSAVFVLGLSLGSIVPARTREWALPQARALLLAAAAALLVSGVGAVVDYKRVVDIFVPPPGASSLEERIAAGQRSVLFSHHADYAAVTTAEPPSSQMPGFKGATHYLLDSRLMMAWAQALHEVGEEDKARYVAQRLKEFRNPNADEFFAPCSDPARAQAAFQCLEPAKPLRFQDFR
jgi:O-antigen ligase